MLNLQMQELRMGILKSKAKIDFDGAVEGLERGIDYQRKEVKHLIAAFRSGDLQRIADAVSVAETWLSEVEETGGGNLRRNIGAAIITHSLTGKFDPFANSRRKLQELEIKYGKV
jgi:hypothetical protein